jgi:hypothetical protein
MLAVEVTFARATRAHALELAANMRDEDVLEVLAGGAASPLAAIEDSLALSDLAFAMLFGGQVAALFGVQPLEVGTHLGPPTRGCVWVLTAQVTNKHPGAYLKHSRPVVAAMLDYCPDLSNFIDARHGPALRWAKWVGAELGEPVPFGPHGALFVPFRVRA